MSLQPLRKMDLSVHGKSASVVATLLATGAVRDANIAADASISQSKIGGLTSDLAAITASVLAEQVRAMGVEQGLSIEIAEEVARALDAEAILRTQVQAAAAGLATEVQARTNADAGLQQQITDEINNRFQADAAEEQARTAADAAIETALEAEVLRAQAAEAQLATDLLNEVERAIAEEQALGQSLLAEEAFRLDGDAQLNTKIDNVEAALQGRLEPIEGNLGAEAAARIAGDAATLSSANAYTDSAVAGLVDSAPGLLDTLNELAAALGDDPNFSTTVLNAVSALDGRVDLLEAKSFHEAFIDDAVGGEIELLKPVGAPSIPDSAATEFFIDGRKMRRGVHFEVAADGSKVAFAALDAGVMVELRYFA